MVPTDGWTLGAGGVVATALLQWVLARWRDLGPLTVAAGGILVATAPPDPPPTVWGGVAVAAVVAAFGWARGGPRGVGHPAMVAVAFGCTVAAVAIGRAVPGAPVVAAAAIGVVGAVLTTVTLRVPGARHPPVRWVGEVDVKVEG
jgi:hypothetical protein